MLVTGRLIRPVEENDEQQNVLLRSKAVRLTVARLDIMWLARGVGILPVTADLVVNLIAGASPWAC
jgi:hypothetical protein